MSLEFSDTAIDSLKEHLIYGQLDWTTENTLDETSIKKLKGCRKQLVEDCLKLILALDNFGLMSEEKKSFSIASTQHLVECLKTYLQSSERYPRLKRFLNVIPDHTNGMVGFTLFVTSMLSFISPPFAVIPISIFLWILMDLSFNNREAASELQECLYLTEQELKTLQTADSILKTKKTPAQNAIQTSIISPAGPCTRKDYSAHFYGSTESESTNQDEIPDPLSTSGLTLN